MYTAFHARRYATLISLLSTYVKSPDSTIIDVGRSQLTAQLHELFTARVDSLGLEADRELATGYYYHMDLNDTQYPNLWPKNLPTYDAVIAAEVIEHLHVSPFWVFSFLRTLMNRTGVLIVQTPNAVALHNRLIMLSGHNPFELIRQAQIAGNPGHFREYTMSELRQYAKKTGFKIIDSFFGNYFDYRVLARNSVHRHLLSLVVHSYDLVPSSLRPGITIVMRQETEPATAS